MNPVSGILLPFSNTSTGAGLAAQLVEKARAVMTATLVKREFFVVMAMNRNPDRLIIGGFDLSERAAHLLILFFPLS